MFVLKSTLELIRKKDEQIDKLKDDIEERKEDVEELKAELRVMRERADRAEKHSEWEMEKVKNEVRKRMEKALIESDLTRTEAVAKLNTYIDMDTKDERKHIQDMLEKAIEGLGNRTEVKIVKE